MNKGNKEQLMHGAKGQGYWQEAWRRLKKNKLAVAGMIFFIFMTLLCFLGPFFLSHSFEEQDLNYGPQPPSGAHWMGTDDLGRDIMARVLYGGRVSLGVGFAATAVSLIIGVSYGAIAGYLGGKTDAAMMRIVDILYALPFLIFVILLSVFFGRNIWLLFIAIGAVEWLTMARIVRGQVLGLKNQTFIDAAIAMGAKQWHIIFKHLIPNVIGPVIVYATLTVPSVMLLEAALSFLGLGVQAPNSSWGEMINKGAESMEEHPWRLWFPAAFFSATLFALNFLGDGLRDALDPRALKSTS